MSILIRGCELFGNGPLRKAGQSLVNGRTFLELRDKREDWYTLELYRNPYLTLEEGIPARYSSKDPKT